MPRHAEAERIDERVAAVAGVEHDLPRHVGDADAVAIARDAGHHAAEQVPVAGRGGGIGRARAVLGRVERAEAQAVAEGDRAGAHREDVADDATDAGGGTLVRLDRTGVVVRLDLEDHREPVTDVERAGVLTGADQDARATGGQRAEEGARMLVGTVLGPHGAEHAELDVVRLAAEAIDDRVVFVLGEAVALGRNGEGHAPVAARVAPISADPSDRPSAGRDRARGSPRPPPRRPFRGARAGCRSRRR